MSDERVRTCMFDVGLQNSDLAVARFPALFSIWHDVSAPALASYFL